MFDNLKHALTHEPVLQPLDYTKYYSLYVDGSLSSIGMVLVQTDKHDLEHVIYYASKSMLDSETRYPYVEKYSLSIVIVIQKFRHYIFLCITTVYAEYNPMYYFSTH